MNLNYQRINNLIGWAVFIIATVVYLKTLEPTGSFWDCGEFASCSKNLMVPHPPGAPFYLLMGRFFSIFGSTAQQQAYLINSVSAISSSLTILFMFWSITMLARKLVLPQSDGKYSLANLIIIMGSGVVGSLAFAFSDTFWFSSEEAEVYAMSSFFTAFVFWGILKWESHADEPDSDRWIILLAFMTGLSIGVHLLNLVALPALAFVYYFKRFKWNPLGLAITFIASVILIYLIMNGFITGLPSIAASTDIFFTNSMGFSPNTGALFFMVVCLVILGLAVWATSSHEVYASKRYLLYAGFGLFALLSLIYFIQVIVIDHGVMQDLVNNDTTQVGVKWGKIFLLLLFNAGAAFLVFGNLKVKLLNTIFLCVSFILIGYSCYTIIVIRSLHEPNIDMNDPQDALSFEYYLNREQYGDRPLLYGPVFTAYDYNNPVYKNRGVEAFLPEKPMYRLKDSISINSSGDTTHVRSYEAYDVKYKYRFVSDHMKLFPRMHDPERRKWRYYKYFLSITGDRNENRIPSVSDNIKFMFRRQIGFFYLRYFMWNFVSRESSTEWKWSIPANEMFKSKKDMPKFIQADKGRNNYYALPLILGLAGMAIQFLRNKKDFMVLGLLFFFTGIGIVIYLNQPPDEPRERDYTSVGSFYAFGIWIGLGVMAIYILATEFIKQTVAVALAITVLCSSVPTLMAIEGWDDHDRSKRFHAVDSATNILNSCDKNAIIFTVGDNDTYPLWYAQEVEGIRRDVRVCNLSLLGTSWYISQMKRQAYESAPLPISLKEENYLDGVCDFVKYSGGGNDRELNLQTYFTYLNARNPLTFDKDENLSALLPSKILSLKLDSNVIAKANFIPDSLKKSIPNKMTWAVMDQRTNSLSKHHLIMLDIIANNNWQRPIYFSATAGEDDMLGLRGNMQLEGLAYRLMPYQVLSQINTSVMYKNYMEKFAFRNQNDSTIFYEDHYLRMFPGITRRNARMLAMSLIMEGKKEEAAKVLNKVMDQMPDHTIPFDDMGMLSPLYRYNTASYVSLYLKLGDEARAKKIAKAIEQRTLEKLDYYKEIENYEEYNELSTPLALLYISYQENGRTQEAANYENLGKKYFPVEFPQIVKQLRD